MCGSCGALGCDRARWSWVRAHVGGLGARWWVVWTRRVGLRVRSVRCVMQGVMWHVFIIIFAIQCVPSSVVPSHPSSAHFFRSFPVVRRCRVRFRVCDVRCCMCDVRCCHFGIIFVICWLFDSHSSSHSGSHFDSHLDSHFDSHLCHFLAP